MAITVESLPGDNVAASKCFQFELSQTAPADPDTTRRKIEYQLLTEDDDEVTNLRSYPYTGVKLKVDFKKDVVPFFKSFVPKLNTIYNTSIDFATGFKLKYAEIDFDLTSCTAPADPVYTETAVKNVWNVYPQFNEYPFDNFSIPILMTYRPIGVWKMAYGQWDWLYFAPGYEGMDMTVRQYSIGGLLVQTNVYGFNGGNDNVICFGISGNNTGGVIDVNSLSRIELDITHRPADTPIGVITIEFYKPCEDQEYRELYFVEPLGGVSSVRFLESDVSASRATSKLESDPGCTDSSVSGFLSGGISIANSDSYLSVTLKKYIDGIQDWAAFYNGLIASRFHWIAVKDSNGVMRMAKFLIDDGEIVTKNDSEDILLIVRGRIHKSIYVHEKF